MDASQVFDGLRLPLAIVVSLVTIWIMFQLIIMAYTMVKVRRRKLEQMEAVIQYNLALITKELPTQELVKKRVQEQLQLEARLSWQCFLVNHVGRLPGRFFRDIAERAEGNLLLWRGAKPLVHFWSSWEVPCLVRRYPHPRRPGEIYYGLYDRFELYQDLV